MDFSQEASDAENRGDPPIQRCSECGRGSWDSRNLGHTCGVRPTRTVQAQERASGGIVLKHGTTTVEDEAAPRCPGIFEAVSA